MLDLNRQIRLDERARTLQRAIQNEADARNAGRIEQAERYAKIVQQHEQSLKEYQALLDDLARRRGGPGWEARQSGPMPRAKIPLGPRTGSPRVFDYHGISVKGESALKSRYKELQAAAVGH